MQRKITFAIFLIIFLSGCATTSKTQSMQVQQLQSRINYLETELQKKNDEINSLEDELRTVYDKGLSSKDENVTHAKMSLKQIQTALKNAGFYKGPIDEKRGPQTKEAIKAFQKANGLKSDGIVGRRTAEKLGNYLR